ncbi:MAG: tetratricopeptide repeat protein [Candidatus Rokubacteria bacterium]|nr:tetratricopeptide repeat protein [Candidatus Rokubacteria bacterium]
MALPGWVALREAGPWRWVLAAGVGLLVLLALGFGGWGWHSAVQSRGVEALAGASTRAQEALAPQATATEREAAIRALEEVIARYPSNRLVGQAVYHLGNLRYQAGSYEAARNAYTLALAKEAKGSLASLCRVGVGYTWEAQGKYAEALAAYQEALVSVRATDFLYEEVLMSIARAQELTGKRDHALDTYRRILRELPQSRRADDIRARLASLESPSSR